MLKIFSSIAESSKRKDCRAAATDEASYGQKPTTELQLTDRIEAKKFANKDKLVDRIEENRTPEIPPDWSTMLALYTTLHVPKEETACLGLDSVTYSGNRSGANVLPRMLPARVRRTFMGTFRSISFRPVPAVRVLQFRRPIFRL